MRKTLIVFGLLLGIAPAADASRRISYRVHSGQASYHLHTSRMVTAAHGVHRGENVFWRGA